MANAKTKRIPLRMCVACREMKNKSELLRVVKSPDGKVVQDNSFKADGRGAYICKRAECVEKAAKTKALSRAFKAAIPEEVYIALKDSIN